MSDSIINTEELIEIPSYLSDANYGISLAASCYNNQIGDCGSCQFNTEECSASQYGSCDVCQGDCQSSAQFCAEGCSSSCERSCQSTCEGSCQLTCENSSQCSCQTTAACQSVSSCMNYCQKSAETCGSCESCQGCQTGCEVASQRPANWVWVTNVATGAPILFTADEWNGFTDRINEFRTYKRLSNITFTKAAKGQFIMASHIVEGWNAINDMSPPSALPEKVAPGSTITAISLNGLVSSLNSIQ